MVTFRGHVPDIRRYYIVLASVTSSCFRAECSPTIITKFVFEAVLKLSN
jgi:hypothetical protein